MRARPPNLATVLARKLLGGVGSAAAAARTVPKEGEQKRNLLLYQWPGATAATLAGHVWHRGGGGGKQRRQKSDKTRGELSPKIVSGTDRYEHPRKSRRANREKDTKFRRGLRPRTPVEFCKSLRLKVNKRRTTNL